MDWKLPLAASEVCSESAPPRVVTAGFDRPVGTFVPSADGRIVFLLAEDQGRQKLFTIPVAGGTVQEIGRLTEGTIGSLDAARSAPIVVATFESAVNPPEVVRIDPASGARTPL